MEHAYELLHDYTSTCGSLVNSEQLGGGGGGGGEMYEKGTAEHGDRTFQKFQEKLSKFPNQVIRFVFNN